MWRGRVSTLAIGSVMAIVALLALKTDMVSGGASSLDPGPLSAAHSHFASASSCGTCHTAFGQGAKGWWQAFWSPKALMPTPGPAAGQGAQTSGAEPNVVQASLAPAARPSVKPAHRLSAACIECHGFGGNEQQAHNRIFEHRADQAPTDCLMCHTEHKGRVAQITTLSEAQCQTCHIKIIKDFATGHPAFHANFPYEHARSVSFDHVNHFSKHFEAPASANKVPTGGCVGCHIVGRDDRAIRPGNFAAICANCHSEGIAKRDFVFFRWPEIEANAIPGEEVAKACGPSAEAQPSRRRRLAPSSWACRPTA
jgi:ferredoxin